MALVTTDPLVKEYLDKRHARDVAQQELDDITQILLKQMQADQRKSFRWTDGDVARTVTYVQKYTTIIDEKRLRRALTARVFDRYTKRVLDRTAMERAMDTGDVDPKTVATCVEQKPMRPYLEYREKEVTP